MVLSVDQKKILHEIWEAEMKHWTSLSEGLFTVGYIKGHNQRGPVSALARSPRVPLTFSVCLPPFQYIFDSKDSYLQPFFSGLFSGY